MNKFVKDIFLLLFPFIPFWSWLCVSISDKPIDFFLIIGLLPISIFFLANERKRLPNYLILFISFTLYHLLSAFLNNAFSDPNINKIYFVLSDTNVLACILFIIIEHVVFDKEFIAKMNKHILIIVFISLIVSIIQIKIPTFFTFVNAQDDLIYTEQSRNFSIYSWTNLNSLGISFPIMISLMISQYENRKSILSFVILSDIIVSFLTKARYVMISGIVVITQLFFNSKRSVSKKISFIFIIALTTSLIFIIAEKYNFDISAVISNRILEEDSDLSSAKTRILSYEVFLLKFPEHPWFGVGPNTKQDVVDLLGGEAPLIHVGYLSYLYFYGVFGCLIFFSSIFFLLRDAWQVGKRDNFWGSYYGLITFCLANFTFVYFNFSEMGIVLAIIYLRYHNRNAYLRRLNAKRNNLKIDK